MSDVIQQVVGNLKFIQEAARLNGLTKTWTKAQESIDALQALQGGEPVVFTCHGNNAPAYGCNKPGDMSGTYYTTPQPVVPDEFVMVSSDLIRDAIRDLKEVQMRLIQCGTYANPQLTVRICLDRTLEALLSAGKGTDRG
jgi:hypothetical protein